MTRPEDAIAAADSGADAVGLIFYPKSSRFVSVDQARRILLALPPMVCPVALFVNSSVEEIRDTATSLCIRTIQLHGDEAPEMLGNLTGFTVIKAVKCDVRHLPVAIQTWTNAAAKYKNLAGILLETANTDQPGGSGVENDWDQIQSVLNSRETLPPMIAAGGLTPENVGTVVRQLRPYAVDVSSGIEQSRGIKSVDKMRLFAAEVHRADAKIV